MFSLGALVAANAPDYQSALRKFDLIRSHRAGPGAVVLNPREINAYVRAEAPKIAREGIREPRVELGNGRATGYAFIDFAKLRKAQGKPMGWFASRLLGGERPVRVDARIVSGGGRATVNLERVEVSGLPLTGNTLDYLVHNYLQSYFPSARPNQPFELAHNIDRLEVRPSGVGVVIAPAAQPWRRIGEQPRASAARR